jgi:hypothetical protein
LDYALSRGACRDELRPDVHCQLPVGHAGEHEAREVDGGTTRVRRWFWREGAVTWKMSEEAVVKAKTVRRRTGKST